MIRIVSLLAGLFIGTSLFGQDYRVVDSLEHAIEVYTCQKIDQDKIELADTTKVDLLFELAGMFINPNPEKVGEYVSQAEVISAYLNDFSRLSLCSRIYGCSHFTRGQYDLAIDYFNQELNFLDSIDCSPNTSKDGYFIKSEVYNNISSMYSSKGNYVEGLRYNLMALKISEEAHDTNFITRCYIQIGSAYESMKKNEEAREYFRKALDLAIKNKYISYQQQALLALGRIELNLGNDSLAMKYLNDVQLSDSDGFYNISKVDALGEIGLIYEKQGDTCAALLSFNQQFTMSQENGLTGSSAWALVNKADVYSKAGNYDLALKYLHQSLDTAKTYNIKYSISGTSMRLASVYFKIGNFKRALFYSNLGLEMAKEINSPAFMVEAYKNLVDIHSGMKNYKAAYENHVLYKMMNDSIFNEENGNRIAQMGLQYEMDKTEQEYQSAMDKKDAVQKVALLNQKQEKKFYIAGGLFLFLLSGGLVNRLLYSRKTKRQLEVKNIQIETEKLRAEQSERFKQQFLTNMSHEIRTPMNAMMGMTNLLLQKQPRSDQQPYLSGIQKSSETLLHIINDILDLSKIEAGKIEIEKIDFSLLDVARQVEQILQLKTAEKDLHLFFEVDPTIPVLLGDPVRLYQVIMNLVGNAIKFTEKGSVHLAIHRMPASEGSPLIPIQFKVADTGIGIPKDKLDTVFEHFKQASSSDSRKYGGTGLGLTISKQLVELLGGTIAIESEEGVGTTFSFVLKFEAGSAERLQHEMDHAEAIDGSILNGLKILVADDNEYNLIVATDSLRLQADLTIMTAHNGNEAIRLLEENDFDLILMDVQMPEKNGFETTRYIRDHFDSPKKDIPIIALTASVLRVDLDKTKQAGMNAYLSKPYTTAQLIRSIAEVMKIKLRLIEKQKSANQIPLKESLPDTTVTDLTYLRNFCNQDTVAMKKYVTMFLDTAPSWLEKLQSAKAKNNYNGIALELHAFSTKFMMFGMHRAKALAKQIEHQCRNGTPLPDTLSTDLLLLIELVEQAIMELKESDLAV